MQEGWGGREGVKGRRRGTRTPPRHLNIVRGDARGELHYIKGEKRQREENVGRTRGELLQRKYEINVNIYHYSKRINGATRKTKIMRKVE